MRGGGGRAGHGLQPSAGDRGGCVASSLASRGVSLTACGLSRCHLRRRRRASQHGWRCLARGSSRGSLILLHGIADNRASLSGVIARFFSDLKTVARERAPFVLSGGLIKRAFAIAEQRGGFSIDTVDVTAAASKITRPVLLVHGTDDSATSPDHSRRVDDALAGQKELILVPGAGHNESLKKGETWDRIEWWIEDLVANLKL